MSNWDGRDKECIICWEPFSPLFDEREEVCPLCEKLLGDDSDFVEEFEEEGEE